MGKILNTEESIQISKTLKKDGRTIVLVGGCFDILHLGHIIFLEKAKKLGNSLFVILESDETVGLIKGKNRPINRQEDRAKILQALNVVDYIVTIPRLKTDREYDDLIKNIKPDTIATTKGDPYLFHKKRQAKIIDAKLFEATERVPHKSTTEFIKLISKELL